MATGYTNIKLNNSLNWAYILQYFLNFLLKNIKKLPQNQL